MERKPRTSFIEKNAVQESWLPGAVIVLVLVMAVFALPMYGAKFESIRDAMVRAVLGEDIVELGRHQIAKSLEERLYWGGLVATANPSLSSFEINEIGRAILRYSDEYNLPPNLIVAVIKVESSGRVSAVSPKGAQGLMQVMPFWKDKLGIEGTLFDIDNNIRAGTRILSDYINSHGFKEGISRYYRGTLPVSGDHYYGKVQKAMQSIS